MKLGWVLAISIFILFPAYSAAFSCGNRQWSYRAGKEMQYDYVSTASCIDSCVQFKCIVEDDVLVMGGGCYQAFENACRYVPTIDKEKIKKNMRNFHSANSSIIFASKSEDEGGTKEYEKMIGLKPEVEKHFAEHIETRWDGKEIAKIVEYQPRKIKPQVQCGVKQSCKPGSKFDKFDIIEYSETKTSTACVSYMCTVDGKKIISGSGTFEEFDKACGNVADSDKKVVKDNIKNSFHYGSNFVVASCSHDDNCSDLELKRYIYINKEAFDPFSKYIDKSYNQKCDYQPLKMPETASSTPNTSFNFKLFWMVALGFVLTYLW